MGRLNKLQVLTVAATVALTTLAIGAEEKKEEYPVVFNTNTTTNTQKEDVVEVKDEKEQPKVVQEEKNPAPPTPVTAPKPVAVKKSKDWGVDVALSYGSKGIIRYTHNKFFDGHTVSSSLAIRHNPSGLYIGGIGMVSPEGGANSDTADRLVALGGIKRAAGSFGVNFEYQYIATTPTIWGTDLIKDQHDVVLRIDLPPMLDQWFLVRTLAGYNANAQEEKEKGIAFAGVGANLSLLIFPGLVSKNQFDVDVELVGKKTVNYTPKTNISSSFRVRARNVLAPESMPVKLVGEANYLRGLRNDKRTEEFWFATSVVITF